MNEFQKSVEKFIAPDLKERYRDFKYVGQGGMGRIVSAHDTLLDKRVAIKLLPVVTYSDTALVRFHQEAKAISKLNHLNIVKVLDFGFTSTEEPYLVMDYIAGTPLDTVIEANQTIPLRTAIQIGIELCEGLQHAHFNGVIHRDLKPSNVMMIEDNRVRILDFGLAKLMDQTDVDHRLTRKGQAMGSPLFMSPEQVRGEEADERADVFGLGMLLYKMISGRVPHEDENLMVLLRSRLEEEPPALPPNMVTPVLTDAVNAVLRKALAVDPAERFQTMAEFQTALEELKDVGEKVKPAELKIPKEPFRFKRIHAAILSVFVLGTLITLVVLNHQLDEYETVHKRVKVTPERIEVEPTVIKKLMIGEIPRGFEEWVDKGTPWWRGRYNRDEDFYRLLGSSVKMLSVRWNPRITEKGMEIISRLKLDSLDMSETRLGDETIDALNKMNLRSLDIRGTKITNAGIARLKPKTSLVSLDVGYLKQFDDSTLKLVLNKFPNLQKIVVSNTKVSAKGLRELKPNMIKISAAAIKLTDKDLEIFATLKPTALDLEGNLLTDKCIPAVMKNENLEEIGFDYTLVTPAAVATLKTWKPELKVSNLKLEKKHVDDLTKTLFDAEDHI